MKLFLKNSKEHVGDKYNVSINGTTYTYEKESFVSKFGTFSMITMEKLGRETFMPS